MRNLYKKLDSLNQIRLDELKNITIIELDYRVQTYIILNYMYINQN